MKILLTIITLFQFCFVFGQTFNVTTENIDLEVKELIKPATKVELTHAVKYKDIFYCFFNEVKKDNSRRDIKFFFIFSKKGENLRKIGVPNEIQNTVYFDLFLRNDSIFAKTYMDSKTFYFDRDKQKWRKTSEVDDMIYEDDRFYFTYLDFGEWGSTTWVKDKQTGKEYELASSGEIINKVDSTYYITSALRIIKIDNPTNLKLTDKDNQYETIRKKDHADGTRSLQGAEIVFNDTTFSEWDWIDKEPKLRIVTSFVRENKLYHFCVDSTKTFVAELENGKMKPIQNIESKLSFFDWYYSYRSKIQKDGSQLLKYNRNNKFGIIEINGQEINIYRITIK
jgi:hypothetical protein